MFITLKAIKVDNYGFEIGAGSVVIQKDQIAAIHNSTAFNFDQESGTRNKSGYYRGSCVVHLTSGKTFHVEDSFTEVKQMLLNTKEV